MKTKFRTSGYEILQFQNLMKNLLVVVKSVRLNIHIAAIINHKTMVQNEYRLKFFFCIQWSLLELKGP